MWGKGAENDVGLRVLCPQHRAALVKPPPPPRPRPFPPHRGRHPPLFIEPTLSHPTHTLPLTLPWLACSTGGSARDGAAFLAAGARARLVAGVTPVAGFVAAVGVRGLRGAARGFGGGAAIAAVAATAAARRGRLGAGEGGSSGERLGGMAGVW